MRKDESGFSLLECLLVCAIASLLAVLAAPHFVAALRASREARAIANLRAVAAAQLAYQASSARFALPAELVRDGFIPADAFTRTGDPQGAPSATETLSDGTYDYSARFSLGATGITLDADPVPSASASHRRFRIRLGRASAGRGGGEAVLLVAPPSRSSPPSRAYRPLGS